VIVPVRVPAAVGVNVIWNVHGFASTAILGHCASVAPAKSPLIAMLVNVTVVFPVFDTVNVSGVLVNPMASSPNGSGVGVIVIVPGAVVLNVAVTVSGPAGIANVQVAPDTVHAVGVPLQLPNAPPAGGVSVRVTAVLNVAFTAQPWTPAAGPQLILPLCAFTALLVTVPPSVPARFTVNK
jgi:hypothetical protein